ncbi:MAG: choice-of-anchor L domain-containing protein [Aquincola tertiaricarbonis]
MKQTHLLRPVMAALLAMAACLPAARAAAVVTPLADGSAASAAALVDTLLGAESRLSVVAGSASYTGQASASGRFTGGGTGDTGLGIDSGVVLSTGDARFIGSSAAFEGDAANQTGTYTAGVGNGLTANTAAGHALFGALTSEPTFNASVLSFSFVPQHARLTMSFVFASEDYNDLVDSGFPTDVFGVFVNGVNQALVPGTGLAISASSVHCVGAGSHCGLYRDNPAFFDTVDTELDGLTVVMNLEMAVNAGHVNILSIGIADTLDTVGDSAVMLAAGSVSAVPEASTWALMLGGLAAMAATARRRRHDTTTA